jgi:hypothetical protein
MFYRSALWDIAHLAGTGVYLLQTQIYGYRNKSTTAKLIPLKDYCIAVKYFPYAYISLNINHIEKLSERKWYILILSIFHVIFQLFEQ